MAGAVTLVMNGCADEKFNGGSPSDEVRTETIKKLIKKELSIVKFGKTLKQSKEEA